MTVQISIITKTDEDDFLEVVGPYKDVFSTSLHDGTAVVTFADGRPDVKVSHALGFVRRMEVAD